MALFKVNRGLEENLPQARNDGWAYFTTDNGKFYIDYKDENKTLQRKPVNSEQADKDSAGNIINETYISIDLTDTNQGTANLVNADTLGGVLANEYALKSDLDDITGANIDLSNYVTKQELEDHVPDIDLSSYVTKEELEEYVPDIDLTEYYTKIESDNKYALKSEIESGAVRLDFTVTLPASGWSNTSPYSQTVTVSGISEVDWPQMAQDLSMATEDTVDDLEKNYAYIKYAETALNTITFYCLKGKPTVDLTLIGQVLRGGDSNYENAIGVEF